MKKKAIIAIVSLLTFGQGAWAQTQSFPRHGETGENSESNPYIISSFEDLNALASDVNSGNAYAGKYFKLTAESGLDYTGKTFTPIGYGDNSDGKPFSGIFDGNGKTISGITVNTPSAWGVGLFGYISKATIKNLTITSSSFTANGFVGAIAGSSAGLNNNLSPIIENCHVTSSVRVEATGFAAGGIIGIDNDNLTIKDCTCAATITSTGAGIGGIIGVAYEDSYMVTITDSYYLGNRPAIGENGGHNDGIEKYATINITLLNDDSNATVKNATRISNYNGQKAKVTLSGRTLSKSDWNTLCLPFDMDDTQIKASSLAGATIKELNTTTSNLSTTGETAGTLTLNFTEVYNGNTFTTGTTLEAGKPYIVKWTTTGDNISTPTFNNVTITRTVPQAVEFSIEGSDDKCLFVGQFSPFSIVAKGATGSNEGNLNEIIMLGSGNQLGYSKNPRTLKCFRAHFYVAIQGGSQARNFVLNFGDGMTSLNEEIRVKSEEFATAEEWYTLDGRRINGQPTKKGVYIVNGKKIVIK